LPRTSLKLDLNKLNRQGWVRPGAKVGPHFVRWTYSYTGEEIASGFITANMEGEYDGWLRIQIGELVQTIILIPRPRHFDGHQWYFVCPVTNRYCSVVWMPPGATRFCSRQTWRRQVAYASQFADLKPGLLRSHLLVNKRRAQRIKDALGRIRTGRDDALR
jgi:hypothetical protein